MVTSLDPIDQEHQKRIAPPNYDALRYPSIFVEPVAEALKYFQSQGLKKAKSGASKV